MVHEDFLASLLSTVLIDCFLNVQWQVLHAFSEPKLQFS